MTLRKPKASSTKLHTWQKPWGPSWFSEQSMAPYSSATCRNTRTYKKAWVC